MPISLQQARRAMIKLAAIKEVLSQSTGKRLEAVLEKKSSKCTDKPAEYAQGYYDGYEAGLNAGVGVMQIDFDTIDAEALVAAFDKEPEES